MTNGIIIINKPTGLTSHDVVDRLRQITGIRKIGHTGTLDPLATGVLVLLVGTATKLSNQFIGLDKTYQAQIKLGYTSNTDDREGGIKPTNSKTKPSLADIKAVLQKFTGQLNQVPPMFSAKKIQGKKLYELARQGRSVDVPSKPVTIYKIRLIQYHYPDLEIKVECSSGTFIRALARDLGRALGTGAYLTGLNRLAVGDYSLDQAVELNQLTASNWQKFLIKKESRPSEALGRLDRLDR